MLHLGSSARSHVLVLEHDPPGGLIENKHSTDVSPPPPPPPPCVCMIIHPEGKSCSEPLTSVRVFVLADPPAGFKMAFMSGFCVSAARLAMPDTGLISYGRGVIESKHSTDVESTNSSSACCTRLSRPRTSPEFESTSRARSDSF